MSSIDDGPKAGRTADRSDSEPWPAEAGRHVRSLRGAVTSSGGSELVDTEVAPLLPDLLTRLGAVSRSETATDLEAPDPPDSVSPPSPADEMSVLRRAGEKLRASLAERGGVESEAVHAMVETVERYRELREEVLLRSEI